MLNQKTNDLGIPSESEFTDVGITSPVIVDSTLHEQLSQKTSSRDVQHINVDLLSGGIISVNKQNINCRWYYSSKGMELKVNPHFLLVTLGAKL